MWQICASNMSMIFWAEKCQHLQDWQWRDFFRKRYHQRWRADRAEEVEVADRTDVAAIYDRIRTP